MATQSVVSIGHQFVDPEMRRIRKGMADHDCSMRTFIYIDRLEKKLAEVAARLERLEKGGT